MFTELTRELLDLTAAESGRQAGLFAATIDCCCCSCCACVVFCH